MGDNGAGKSTLIKCVSGVYHPDDGRDLLRGPAGALLAAHRCAPGGHRDDLPGPRAGGQPRRQRQHLPRPRGQEAPPLAARCARSTRRPCAAESDGHPAALDIQHPADAPGDREALRRPAPGRRHRPRHLLERPADDHGRADQQPRRARAAQGHVAHRHAARGRACRSSSSATPCPTSSPSPTASSSCTAAGRSRRCPPRDTNTTEVVEYMVGAREQHAHGEAASGSRHRACQVTAARATSGLQASASAARRPRAPTRRG